MEYRELGSSGIKASVVTFGAWAIGGAMWGGADDADAINAIRTSVDLGITSIDTAPLYGFGKSEQLVGQAVKGMRDKVQIFTKFGLRVDSDQGEYHFDLPWGDKTYKVYKNSRPQSIMQEVEASLRFLGTDYIDLYQCHWRDNTTPVEMTMEAVAKLLGQGKIRAVGVSNFTPQEIEQARKVVPIASDQPPYSMVNRGIEADILPYCRQNNIGVIVYSPLQRGLLTGKFKPGHKFAPGDHRAASPFFAPHNVERVNQMLKNIQPIAASHHATLAQLAVNWAFSQPGVTAALVGARNAKQARENAGAASFRLSDEEMQQINAQLDELKLEL